MKKHFLALSLLGLLMPLVTSNFMDTDAVYRKEKMPTRYGMMEPPEEVVNQTTEYAWLSEQFTMYKERTGFYIGSLICPTRDYFCATLTYELMDQNNETVFLAYVPLHCTKDGVLNHSAMVVFDQGDNFAARFTEIGNPITGTPIIRILHTCQYAFRVREQVSTLEISEVFQPHRYELNITDSEEVTQPMTAERGHFPIGSTTERWLKRVDIRNDVSRFDLFKPVTVRTLHQEKPLPYILLTMWNSVVFERRCQHSTFDSHVYCSKTDYSYDSRNRRSHDHYGVIYGSDEDEFTRFDLHQ